MIETTILLVFSGITAIATCLIAKYSKSNTTISNEIKHQGKEIQRSYEILVSCLTSATLMGSKFGESSVEAANKMKEHLDRLEAVVSSRLQSK